jgi:DNA-binding MarR family transcriptional regulator
MPSPRQTAALIIDNVPMLMRLLRTKFREKRSSDLSMVQFRTLAFVDANQGASLSEAASHIGLSLPSMSKLVDVLVRREMLTREMHGEDRRRICLALTGDGKQALDEAYQHTQAYFAEKFALISVDERAQIAAAMDLMKNLFALNPMQSIPETPEE